MTASASARREAGARRPPAGSAPTPGLTGFQRVGVATVLTTLALVALGGAVRATGSGLACPDWPFCYGQVIPRQADIPPETGYTLWNVWLEHTHRLVASVVGLLVVILLVWAVARFRHRPSVLWPSVAAVVLVGAQAGLGAVVVLRLLRAELVTAHLGMAMVVVACVLYVTVTAALPRRPRAGRDLLLGRGAAAVALLGLAQILVGGHVTGIGAGLEWTTFPLMDGQVVPQVATEREAFHVAHRLLAYALAAGVAALWWVAARQRRQLAAAGAWGREHRWLLRLPAVAAGLVAVQVALGVGNLVTGSSAVTVTPHLAVASWIWTVLVLHTLLAYRHAPAPAPAAARAGGRAVAPGAPA